MKKIKKRGAVYGVIALLLCAAAYLNWSYVDTPEDLLAAQQTDAQADTQTDASADSTAGEGDYFASSRLTRTQARDEAVSTLKELSESDTADQSAKDDAAAQISALADDTVAEANIESLIRAKGYEDAVVMLGDGSANIVVAPPDGGLQAEDVVSYKGVKSNDNGDAGLVLVIEAADGKAEDIANQLTAYQQDQVAFYGNYAEFAEAQSNVENAIIDGSDNLVVMVIASNGCSADLTSAVNGVLGK